MYSLNFRPKTRGHKQKVHFAGYRFGYTGYMRFCAKFSKRMLTVVIVEGNLDLFQLRNICHQTHYFECNDVMFEDKEKYFTFRFS